MQIGTRSLLFGAHQFLLHPLVLAYSWWRLFGFQTVRDGYVATHLLDWRLWLCFLVHDWGYFGCPEMDGPVGEAHPFAGARLVSRLLDRDRQRFYRCLYRSAESRAGCLPAHQALAWLGPWGLFCVTHSRFLAQRLGRPTSALCAADKYAIGVLPAWAYLPLAWASGELAGYVRGEGGRTGGHPSARAWYAACADYCQSLARAQRDEIRAARAGTLLARG